MRWRDASAAPGSRYAYRIQALKSAGADWYGPVTLSIPAAPKELALRRATPNPFSGSTRLALDMPSDEGALRLDVFDVAGRHVRTLRHGPMSPGQGIVDWDGLDDHGSPARGGLYVVRLQGVRGTSVMRVMKLD
jgi:flagellar hook assembly protein FlgD